MLSNSRTPHAARSEPRRLDPTDWYAVQAWAGREQFASSHLRLRGYEIFLPTHIERRRWSDRVKTIECALFPGYMFCRLNTDAVAKIVASPGVIGIVGDGRGPVSIPAHEVEVIQRIIEARLNVEPWQFMRVGQRVRIELGPLSGAEGSIIQVRNRNRFVVSIPLLQRSVAVEVDADWLKVPWASLREQGDAGPAE
jgi:transcription antitermination factor NusG